MKKYSLSILVVVLMLVVLITSCNPNNTTKPNGTTNGEMQRYTTYDWSSFDTVSTITGYATSGDEFDKIANEIISMLREYHELYDIYNPYNGKENLYTINKLYNGEHRVVTVDQRIIDMLLYAKEMYNKTNGKMNIAMGSVLSIWHDYRAEADENFGLGELPPMADLQEAAKHVNIDNLIIDEANRTVYISDPQMTLDVGAIAKGYAVEMIAKTLEKRGISNFVLNVGGNIRTIGTKANGDKWVAGVENPGLNIDKDYIAYIGLSGEAIVTSGSYQRYYIVDGKAYHHIIDFETLMPATYFQAVSIICPHSGMGDGLSTALFCMPIEDGMAIIESLEGVEAMWTYPDGTIVKSSGFSNYEVER